MENPLQDVAEVPLVGGELAVRVLSIPAAAWRNVRSSSSVISFGAKAA